MSIESISSSSSQQSSIINTASVRLSNMAPCRDDKQLQDHLKSLKLSSLNSNHGSPSTEPKNVDTSSVLKLEDDHTGTASKFSKYNMQATEIITTVHDDLIAEISKNTNQQKEEKVADENDTGNIQNASEDLINPASETAQHKTGLRSRAISLSYIKNLLTDKDRLVISACKFETALQHQRRRFPYSLGLGNPPRARPWLGRARLQECTENQLSVGLLTLYEQLLPSAEAKVKRDALVQKLERILKIEFPDSEISLHVFGSTLSGLYTENSDGKSIFVDS